MQASEVAYSDGGSSAYNKKKQQQITYEGYKLGKMQAEYERVLGGNTYRYGQFQNIVSDNYYLQDFDSTEVNINRQIQKIQNDIRQIGRQFDSSMYNRRAGEATNIKKDLQQQANEQIEQLQELLEANEERKKAREVYLEEEKSRIVKEIETLRQANEGNPLEFNETGWNIKWYESIKKVNDAKILYKDDKGMVAYALMLRQEEAKQLQSEKTLGLLDAAKSTARF